MARTKILTISCIWPTPAEPGHGLFIRSRVSAMAEIAEVQVAAPLPALDYGNPHGRLFQAFSVAGRRRDGELDVGHPRWFYPPLGGAFNAGFLAARMLPYLASLRRRFRFDIIDAQHGHPDGTAAEWLSRYFGCPYAITLRGNETVLGQAGLLRRTMGSALRGAARVIAVSESLRRFALDVGVEPGRARTIPNGVNARLFYPRPRAEMRRKLGLPETGEVVLSAGRLSEGKGHHRVVEALAQVVAGGQDAHLAIVGGGSRENAYEARIRRQVDELGLHGRVRLAGEVAPEALAEWMSAADVFCLASRREGWPNVVHEAMACGSPIVATDVGGMPDLVPSERYGTLVGFGDAPALAAALGAALRRPWNRDEIRAWAHARSWQQVAREEVDEFKAAVAEFRQTQGEAA